MRKNTGKERNKIKEQFYYLIFFNLKKGIYLEPSFWLLGWWHQNLNQNCGVNQQLLRLHSEQKQKKNDAEFNPKMKHYMNIFFHGLYTFWSFCHNDLTDMFLTFMNCNFLKQKKKQFYITKTSGHPGGISTSI